MSHHFFLQTNFKPTRKYWFGHIKLKLIWNCLLAFTHIFKAITTGLKVFCERSHNGLNFFSVYMCALWTHNFPQNTFPMQQVFSNTPWGYTICWAITFQECIKHISYIDLCSYLKIDCTRYTTWKYIYFNKFFNFTKPPNIKKILKISTNFTYKKKKNLHIF